MKNLLERLREARAARHENRDAGFSLIELIVVIAIIGILIAIAIPVYGGIQQRAKDNQLENAAATGASMWAAQYAESNVVATADAAVTGLTDDEITYTIVGTSVDLGDFCIQAAATPGGSVVDGTTATSGPGCP